MFSPTTAAAVLNCRNQNCSQEPSTSVDSIRCTSPRLQPAAAHARGGASSQGLPSCGTTESRRGGGTNTNTATTPARRLPFASVGWKTPVVGTYSVSSMSSRCSAVATDPPPATKRAKRTPDKLRGRGVLFTTLMMVVINMIMRTILSQTPMVQSKTLRTTCSLLKSSRTH